ncbi:hypothetical protein Acsp05_28480 [Actinokineospora sp. NBRC 105648]|nr:hypothetical protein Acsp05_28480 [Actinokineospora sp. NBRC 105648]
MRAPRLAVSDKQDASMNQKSDASTSTDDKQNPASMRPNGADGQAAINPLSGAGVSIVRACSRTVYAMR